MAKSKKGPKPLPPLDWADRTTKTSRHLPLIGSGWNEGVETTPPCLPDRNCTKCELGEKRGGKSCVPPLDVVPGTGGILLVLPWPEHGESLEWALTQKGPHRSLIVTTVQETYSGPLRLTTAVRCSAGEDVESVSIDACRPYLVNEILEYKPSRIISFGTDAAESLLGHRAPLHELRKAWSRVLTYPAFHLPESGQALYNSVASKQFKEDLTWAVASDPGQPADGTVTVLTTPDEVAAFVRSLPRGKATVVDVETRGKLWFADFELLCLGVCVDPASPVVIPGDVAKASLPVLKAWLEDPSYQKMGHNFKYDCQSLYCSLGIDVKGTAIDTLVWSHMVNSDSAAGLKALAWQVGWGGYAGSVKEATKDDDAKKDYGKLPPDTLHLYNGRDLTTTHLVRKNLEPQMDRYRATWDGLDRPAQQALAQVERWGALLSTSNVQTYDTWLSARLRIIDQELALAGVPPDFNPRSSRQVQDLLFNQLKIKPNPKRKTEGGQQSVGAEALEEYAQKSPVAAKLLERGTYAKQKAAFGLSLLDFVAKDGRVHTTYKVVRSGRLSSSKPNLQQIPGPGVKPGEPDFDDKKDSDVGIWARGCWVAPPGYKLVQLDLSQHELRVAAMLSNDEVMAAAFSAGYDFHRMTAAAAYGIVPDKVNAEQRRVAKGLNFALVFGMDEHGIAATTGLTKEKAKELLDSLLSKYKKFGQWRRQQIADAQQNHESFVRWNPDGTGIDWAHRRDLRDMGETGGSVMAKKKRKHAENIALNNPIQSIANKFAIASLVDTVDWIVSEAIPAKLIITVHDALVLEVREDVVGDVANKVKAIMTGWPSGCVDLAVDVEVGDHWGILQKWKGE